MGHVSPQCYAAAPGQHQVEIHGARFDDYMAWDRKQQEKKRRDAISTEGHLLSEPQFGVQLAEKTKKRKDQQEKSEAAKKAKVDRAKEKVIEEYEKEKKKESKLAKEAVVKGLLLHCNVWTSSDDFVRACDMKELIKLNKRILKNIDGFGGSLKREEAMEFLERAVDELGQDAFVTQ